MHSGACQNVTDAHNMAWEQARNKEIRGETRNMEIIGNTQIGTLSMRQNKQKIWSAGKIVQNAGMIQMEITPRRNQKKIANF